MILSNLKSMLLTVLVHIKKLTCKSCHFQVELFHFHHSHLLRWKTPAVIFKNIKWYLTILFLLFRLWFFIKHPKPSLPLTSIHLLGWVYNIIWHLLVSFAYLKLAASNFRCQICFCFCFGKFNSSLTKMIYQDLSCNCY